MHSLCLRYLCDHIGACSAIDSTQVTRTLRQCLQKHLAHALTTHML
jgi:hypothetical protein